MESSNSTSNNKSAATTNTTLVNKDGLENDSIALPSNFLIATKEIIARFPHNKRVGHYLLGRKLGEGSFAKVKEGLHTITGQKVAIKVIDKKKAKEDAYVSKNMRREGKLLQMIIHPNIVQLYELMETENRYENKKEMKTLFLSFFFFSLLLFSFQIYILYKWFRYGFTQYSSIIYHW